MLFVYLAGNLFIAIFGYSFWNLFPSDRMGTRLSRQNGDLKKVDTENNNNNNNNHLETAEERKCK